MLSIAGTWGALEGRRAVGAARGRDRGRFDDDDSDTEEESRRWRMGVRTVYSGTSGQLLVQRCRFHTPPARSEREPAVYVSVSRRRALRAP